jgi:hypothetical protein
MKFNGQNKKRVDARYFLNEEEGFTSKEAGKAAAKYLPTPGKKRGVSGCAGAGELQKLLVDNYPVYQLVMNSNYLDPNLISLQRFRKMLSDEIVGHYFVVAINSFLEKILEKKIAPRNNMNSSYTDDMEGYKAVCRDMEDLITMMKYWESANSKSLDKQKQEVPPTPATTPAEPVSSIGRKIEEPKEGDEMKGELGPEIYHNGEWIPKSEYEQLKRGLKEAKRRDASYNKLKEEKNKKLFNALIKG